jgi:hypothetical protein
MAEIDKKIDKRLADFSEEIDKKLDKRLADMDAKLDRLTLVCSQLGDRISALEYGNRCALTSSGYSDVHGWYD